MEKYHNWRSLSSYSVDHRLLRNLQDFICNGIPRILQHDSPVRSFSDHCRLTLVGLKEALLYMPASSYTGTSFDDDIHLLKIELLYPEEDQAAGQAIALVLRLGSSHADSELSISLQNRQAAEKARAIEEGLLAVLEPHRNLNRIAYPNEFMPTLVFVVGFFIGIGTLMFTTRLLQALCVVLFGISIYLVGRRFTKGYCSFESRRARRLDIFFRWFTTAIALAVFGAVLFIMLQKN